MHYQATPDNAFTISSIIETSRLIHPPCKKEERPMTTLQPALTVVPSGPAATASQPAAPATPTVSAKTWIAVIGATLGAFMAVLNIQIVNASLADIQGAIRAGIDDGGWISTSYLIAEIVGIPFSGRLPQGFSPPHYFL